MGSPPRMRGKLKAFTARPKVTGITPADAGKTQCKHHSTGAEEDHPRGCGENQICTNRIYTLKGSPPRMRGKL